MPDNGEKDYKLKIGPASVPCNIFTGPTGQDGHLTESTGPDGRHAVVKFICNWDDRNDLVAGLVGTVDYVGGVIQRTAPFLYPVNDFDQEPFAVGNRGMFDDRLFCTAVTDVEGLKWARDDEGTLTGLPGWGFFQFAVLTAEFTAPGYTIVLNNEDPPGIFLDLFGLPYAVSKISSSGEVFSPPTGALQWAEGPRTGQSLIDANTGIIRPRFELTVTRIRMPLIPMQTLETAIGTVNLNVMNLGTTAIGAGAALFMGYAATEKSDPYNCGLVYDIELQWLVNGEIKARNANGNWNWFLDPTGEWNGVVTSRGQTPPFDSFDHTQLTANTIA